MPAPRDTRLRPLGLGFVDRELEAQWWARQVRERAQVIRANIGILYASTAGFAFLDAFVFAAHARTLLALRAAMMALLLVPAPWIYGRRSLAFLERHSQHVLAYLTVAGVVPIFAMGWIILGGADPATLLVTLVCALFLQVCIYGTSGLRFAYATPIGLLATAGYFAMLALRGRASSEDLAVCAAFLVGETVIGVAVCFTLEMVGRRDFLLGLELESASRRTERLLLNLMPSRLAARLKEGEGVLDRVPRATVLFASLVGFDDATRGLAPLAAVRLLDRVVAHFDRIARAHGVERIKTVGPTYMAAGGVAAGAEREEHAEAVARAVLAMRALVRELAAREGVPLRLRAGLATGPVVAGVIGRTRLAFDCWGDTANLASRLDSHGEPDRIQIAASTARALERTFALAQRGRVVLKGKGDVETWWLEGLLESQGEGAREPPRQEASP